MVVYLMWSLNKYAETWYRISMRAYYPYEIYDFSLKIVYQECEQPSNLIGD